MMKRRLFLGFALVASGCTYESRTIYREKEPAGPSPRRYTCPRAGSPIDVDGVIDDRAWSGARWSAPFVDIEGGAKSPRYRTRMKLLWDTENLYIGARLEEPHVWATLKRHDEIIFNDNDFEVFIDPDGDARNYYEIETNAFGTTFDLLLVKTYRAKGPAVHGWDLKGLRCAVAVDGTINDPKDVDRAWSVEMALPWRSLKEHAGEASAPPKPGDTWRMNFSRVEWQHEIVNGRYRRVPKVREDNWVWSPQGVIDMHVPGRWGLVTFSEDSDR